MHHKTEGKYYWEVKFNTYVSYNAINIGITDQSININDISSRNLYYYAYTGGYTLNNTTATGFSSYGDVYTTNDIIGIALDIDNKTIMFSKNGVWYSKLNVPIWTEYNALVAHIGSSASGTQTATANFGATPFIYPIPEGYKSYDSPAIYLIKQGNNYYSIKNEYYSVISNQYSPLELQGGVYSNIENINNLTNETTINGEMFRPIDKLFSNFEIINYSK